MGVSQKEAELFLRKNVIIVHSDGSSAGLLLSVSDSAIVLERDHRKTLIALDSVDKIKERSGL